MNNIREIERLNQLELDNAIVSFYPPNAILPLKLATANLGVMAQRLE
jgi:hypothetical protein